MVVLSSWRDLPRDRGVCNFPEEDFTIHEIGVEEESQGCVMSRPLCKSNPKTYQYLLMFTASRKVADLSNYAAMYFLLVKVLR